MKSFLVNFFLILSLTCIAQADTADLHALYAIGMNMNESNADSVKKYADIISRESAKRNYPRGFMYAKRLLGFYYEITNDYEKSIDQYLQTLDEARRQGDTEFESGILTDLAAVYTENLKQPLKAKEIYLACVELNRRKNDPALLVATYTNLSAIYNRLGLYDSSLYFLQEGLNIEKQIPAAGRQNQDLTSLYNNLGNTYFLKKQFSRALPYFLDNYAKHKEGNDLAGIWLDALNISDTYIEQYLFDSALQYAKLAVEIADSLQSPSKKSDTYSILAKYYQRKGDYKNAYEYQTKWYALDTALVNGETYRSIAELQEKYKSRERENERLLLQGEVDRQRFNNRIFLTTAVGLLVALTLIAVAFFIKRNANRQLKKNNDLVIKQNEKLASLNEEKNALISIVSHDLSTPFASINMWMQLLEEEQNKFPPEQQKALDKIKQATRYGENLIRHILDVEKAQTNIQKIHIDRVDMRELAAGITENYLPQAAKKNIRLEFVPPVGDVVMMSDAKLVARICENLLSNAIKYTASGKSVMLILGEEEEWVSILVKDEGVGIPANELHHVFTPYKKLSSKPTNGEPGTGLGLSIVKRLVDELNGKISCESEEGTGTVFRVLLKK